MDQKVDHYTYTLCFTQIVQIRNNLKPRAVKSFTTEEAKAQLRIVTATGVPAFLCQTLGTETFAAPVMRKLTQEIRKWMQPASVYE